MKIIIHQHLGLGDMILCNGLVRYFIELRSNVSKFLLFCKRRHLESIKFMYRDQKKIKLIPISDNPKNENKNVKNYLKKINYNYEFIKIGHEFYNHTNNLNKDQNNPWPCDIIFYKQFNIPFEYRYKKSFWLRNFKKEKKLYTNLVGKNKNFIFVHDDPSRGFKIDTSKFNKKNLIIKNDYKYSIFDYCMILENAKELHLMESSFRQIVETLNIKSKKLYLYKGRGGDHSINLYNTKLKVWIGTKKKWKIVKYNLSTDNKKKLFTTKDLLKFS